MHPFRKTIHYRLTLLNLAFACLVIFHNPARAYQQMIPFVSDAPESLSEVDARLLYKADNTRMAAAPSVLLETPEPGMDILRAQVGSNDFRISNMGPDGDTDYDAANANLAYNATDDEFLVVWTADDNTGSLVNGESEVYGQRINASDGSRLGSRFRISFSGPDGDTTFGIYSGVPSVAWNDDDNEYLVVWGGEDDEGGLIDGDVEIWAARIGGGTSTVIGSQFRISDTGGIGTTQALALAPDVVYNTTSNQYLVVWAGDEVTGPNSTTQIYGQFLTNAGVETGTNDFAISDLQISYDADNPAVAWNSTDNEYMVVWESDDVGDVTKTARGEFEIYGQRLSAAGAEIGTDDFRLSDMGGFGANDADYDADRPEIAYNSTDNQYLVVWRGTDNTAPLVVREVEIFGQFLTNTGAETGTNDFRISDVGDDSEMDGLIRDDSNAQDPDVTYNVHLNEFMVTWHADDLYAILADNENEIYAARVSNTGAITDGDLRLSDVGPTFGNNSFDAEKPKVAYSTVSQDYLIVFQADDSEGTQVDEEREIMGQLWSPDNTNAAPVGVMLSSTFVEEDLAMGDLVASLFGDDADVDDTHTFALVAGDGDDDNASFTISGNSLNSATTFSFGTQSTYKIRIRTTDNSGLQVESEVIITVNEPPAVISGDNYTISDNGPSTDKNYDALNPRIAYNATDDEFLVVWEADDDGAGLANDEVEIWAQRIKASDGSKLGSMIRVSFMGPDGNASYDAKAPAVAWNPDANQYLVVWEANDDLAGLAAAEKEIWGQLLTNTGGLSGSMIRISDMGPDNNTSYAADNPDVVYNDTSNEYLVVWHGDDNSGSLIDSETEIFGQRLTAAGSETGTNDFQISFMGPDGDAAYDANDPKLAWNSTDNEYLVVWESDDNANSVVNDEKEIYASRLSSAGVVLVSDLKVSAMGPVGDKDFDADDPGVVYNADLNKYFVAWESDDDDGALIDNEKEVYGQSVSAAGALDGAEIRITAFGPDGNGSYDAENPEIIYVSAIQEYVVTVYGEHNVDQLAIGEDEIWTQRINAVTGALIGDIVRMSEVGTDGNTNLDGIHPHIAYSPTQKKALLAFQADNATLASREEIHGQLWQVPAPSVTTLSATNVQGTTASLNGAVNANGLSTTVTFEYGTTTAYGQTATTVQSPLSSTDNTAVSVGLTGLSGNTTYHYRVKGANVGGTKNGADATFTTTNVAPTSATVAISVFLEGAYNGTDLNTLLNASIPTTQVYTNNGHNGGESVGAIPANAVDWVLVELREAGAAAAALNATKVGSAAGFLMKDGTIKATDGTSNLTVQLTGNSGSDFFVVIYHRNHLPIMSASAISESGGLYTIDFTTVAANTYQNTTALVTLSTGKFAMPAGDADGDGDVDGTDLTTWRSQNGAAFVYNTTNGDFNLDGVINAVDRNDFQRKNNSKTSQVPTT